MNNINFIKLNFALIEKYRAIDKIDPIFKDIWKCFY